METVRKVQDQQLSGTRTLIHRIQWYATACTGLLMSIHAVASPTNITISPAGARMTVYTWQSDRCANDFIPDAPARAFRRADGKIVLIASYRKNWELIGEDFKSLRPNCHTILNDSADWIEATYTEDGQNILALVSEDKSEEMENQGCRPFNKPGRCWLNQIVAARSTDMGLSFRILQKEDRTVFTLGENYPDEEIERFGAFTTSNIVRAGDSYFVMVWIGSKKFRGNCLFRTDDPWNFKKWQAWDGGKFVERARTDAPSCAPLPNLPREVRSISYYAKGQVWIAVFSDRQKLPGDRTAVPGFYYALSSDLISWTRSKRIMEAPTKPREQQMFEFVSYPSLIDGRSSSRNFDTIDHDSAVLMFTVQHLASGKGTMNRDLQYVVVNLGQSE